MGKLDKNTNYFGLDIGTTGVRMVQLESGESAPVLKSHGFRSYPQDLDTNNKKKLGKYIKNAKDEIGITTEKVVVSVPNRYAFTTLMRTPKLAQDELKTYVLEQAPDLLPMPLESVRLDWHVINPNKDGEMEVLLVAASSDAVEHYIEVIGKTGLELYALEINALAMSRSVAGDSDSAVAVVDLGNLDTEITAILGRSPHVISSVDRGLNSFIESIKQSFNVDTTEAQDFLHKFGFIESKLEGQVLNAVSADISEIITKTKDVIESFLSNNGGVELKKVVLTGAPVSLPGLPAYIADQLNMSVEIANPWVNVVYPAVEHDKLMNESLNFSVAIGLAQRDFI